MHGQISAGNERKFTLNPRHFYLLTCANIHSGSIRADTTRVAIVTTGLSSVNTSTIKWITAEPASENVNISFAQDDWLELIVTVPASSWIVLGLSEL